MDSEKKINTLIENLKKLPIPSSAASKKDKLEIWNNYVSAEKPILESLREFYSENKFNDSKVKEIQTLKARRYVLCGCGKNFDIRRKINDYSSCLTCGENEAHETAPRLNEGLPGTREEHKRMRAQVWGEIRNRNKGN